MLKMAAHFRRKVLGEFHPLLANTLGNLVTVYAEQDQLEEALQLLQQQADIFRRMTGQVFSVASDRQRLALLAMLQPNLRNMLGVIWHIAHKLPQSVPQTFDLLLQRKGLSLEAIRSAGLTVFFSIIAPSDLFQPIDNPGCFSHRIRCQVVRAHPLEIGFANLRIITQGTQYFKIR